MEALQSHLMGVGVSCPVGGAGEVAQGPRSRGGARPKCHVDVLRLAPLVTWKL